MIPKPQPKEITRYKLIGVCGKAGTGKDTVAHYLSNDCRKKHSLWVRQEAFADAIKKVVCSVFNIDRLTFIDRKLKEFPIERLGGYSPRKLAQLVGTDCFRDTFGIWIWVNVLHNRIMTQLSTIDDAIVVSDVRFQNEVQWILEQDGIVVYLTGHGAEPVVAHRSEDIPSIEFCHSAVDTYGGSLVSIENNGSMQELYAAIDKQLVPLLVSAV